MTHAPAVHVPLQQSAFVVHERPLGLHGSEQLPPTQSPLQQSAFVVQTPVVGVHPVVG